MEFILILTALAAAGVLATLRLARARLNDEARRRLEEEAFTARLAEHTRILNDRLVGIDADRRALAEADSRKTRLLVALDERLRGPLNAIRGFVDLTQARAQSDDAHEGLTHRQAQALDQIASAVDRLTAVADELSDLSRAETGRLDLRPEPLDAALMLRRAAEEASATIRGQGVSIHAPHPTVGLGVVADRFRTGQILRVMLDQAVKRTPEGGVVLLEARLQDGEVRLAVRDGGPPRHAQAMERAMRPFARDGDDAGLAAARRLAEAMCGRLVFDDSTDGVSTLVLALPSGAAETTIPTTRSSLPPATLLYVDEDPATVMVVRQILATLGPVSLHAATTGAEAVALARALRPDLILTELCLPDMDGFELCARLAADPLTRHAPILAISARTGPAHWRRARAAGIVACLAKPVEIGAFHAAVSGALKAGPRAAAPVDTAPTPVAAAAT